MRTIAEGIETTHQATELITLGCHTGQGFLYARPQPLPFTKADRDNEPSGRGEMADRDNQPPAPGAMAARANDAES